MGPGFGRGMADAIVAFIIVTFIVGAVVGVGGYFLISWIVSHVSISWS
jgi:hypothetical protein